MNPDTESSLEAFHQNKGKLNILNELISIEESLISHDSEVKEIEI